MYKRVWFSTPQIGYQAELSHPFRLARKLLQARAEVNQQDAKRVSPLHTAVHQDTAQLVQLLLMHNANANAQDQIGQSPVFFAGSTTVIAALIDAKADLHHLNKKGQSALHLAAHNGRFETVAYLTDHEFVDESIDMQDERGRSPLHLAAAQGHQRVVSRLMDVGANPRLKMHNGQTPMTLADKKDTELAMYIYNRMTGGKHATWGEAMQNPMFLTLAAVLGVACFVNRSVLFDLFWELVILRMKGFSTTSTVNQGQKSDHGKVPLCKSAGERASGHAGAMVMHDEGTTVVGAAVMDDMEDIDLQSLDDETQRPGPAEPIPEQLYPGDAFGITGWENIGFMDFLGFELASLSSQHSGFNSLPNVAGRARGGGMGTGSAFVTTLKSFIGMGILSLAFERWARCQGCQGVVFESSFTGTKRHDLTQTQTSSTNNTRRSRADLWILIALGLRSARICAMPAISSFFSRKGKKGKKVEEPQYEALPPPPADPVAPVAPAPGAPGAPGASLEPPAKAGAGAPSGGAPSDRTEPMTEVLPNPSVPDSEKSGKDVDPELGENKVERSLSPKKAEDKARSIVGDDLERAKDRGKLMLMVPVLLLVVGLVLTLVLLFLGAMPAPVQTGFDSLMGRSNACQSGEKGRCVSAAPIMHYYMYRVQNDEDYSPENQNMANIPGALWRFWLALDAQNGP
eukprot:s1713_g4.t2